MLHTTPLNDTYIELLSATARLTKASWVGAERARTVEFMVDVMPTAYLTATDHKAFAGSNLVLGWWEYDGPVLNATKSAPVRFGSVRNSVDKYSGDGTLSLGVRTVLYGKDDGTNVYGWQDGTALGSATSQADWTTAEAGYPITNTGDLFFGFDTTLTEYTGMRLYEAMIRVNGKVVFHLRPRIGDTDPFPDLSEFGNDLTASGTLDTDYRLKTAWNREPAFPGLENL